MWSLRFWWQIRAFMKFCGVAVIVLLVIAALGPAKWQRRTGLGWEIEHFAGYFVATTILLLTWPWSGEPSWR
jgi:hypothetical protein